MAGQLVVGLYESRGYAQDAHNRLYTEGMPWSEMALVVIHNVAPLPEHTREEEARWATADRGQPAPCVAGAGDCLAEPGTKAGVDVEHSGSGSVGAVAGATHRTR